MCGVAYKLTLPRSSTSLRKTWSIPTGDDFVRRSAAQCQSLKPREAVVFLSFTLLWSLTRARICCISSKMITRLLEYGRSTPVSTIKRSSHNEYFQVFAAIYESQIRCRTPLAKIRHSCVRHRHRYDICSKVIKETSLCAIPYCALVDNTFPKSFYIFVCIEVPSHSTAHSIKMAVHAFEARHVTSFCIVFITPTAYKRMLFAHYSVRKRMKSKMSCQMHHFIHTSIFPNPVLLTICVTKKQ